MHTLRAIKNGAVTQVLITSQADVVHARMRARSLAIAADFEPAQVVVVAAAISELARNIVLYARRGHIALELVENGDLRGIRIVATDEGPGIAGLDRTTRPQSTGGGLGFGLRTVQHVMDEFQIDSSPATGTRVLVTKWRT